MLKTKFHNKKITLEAGIAAIDYLKKNTTIRKLIAFVPINYIHVIKYCFKLGFKVCGQIDNGIILEDIYRKLIIFEKDL